MSLDSKEMNENTDAIPSGAEGQETTLGGMDDKSKALRHPRWNREEICVLIEGKTFVENQLQKGRRYDSSLRSDQCEPKWELVSSYCKQHSVNREAYQCQKRWSNLICDFRKIKQWEMQKKGELESFWIMRNDLRKERKLPGFFDKEVYEVLNKNIFAAAAIPLATVAWTADMQKEEGIKTPRAEDEENGGQESTQAAIASTEVADDTLFPVPVQFTPGKIGWGKDKENNSNERNPKKSPIFLLSPESVKGRHPQLDTVKETMAQERVKRTRLSSEDTCGENRLIKVLQRNNEMVEVQLQAYNRNWHLARQQEEGVHERLAAAISKIGDALGKIADKL